MGVSDWATQREEEFREDALRRMARQRPTPLDSARECRVCDEPIPQARRRALPGVQTCIECQTDLEQSVSIRHPRSAV